MREKLNEEIEKLIEVYYPVDGDQYHPDELDKLLFKNGALGMANLILPLLEKCIPLIEYKTDFVTEKRKIKELLK